ncbi:MAG: MFS transporter [Nitrospiraceae bacterium]|nr:MAG: MFS transporter [Nitrospiraceae bacterium]
MNSVNPLESLRHRNFRMFWFGQLISLTGTWMHQAAQGWLVFQLTESPFFLGLAGTAASSPILLFTLAGGVMADRHPKRYILLSAHILLMILALILTVLVVTDTVNVWFVLALAFMIGTVHAFEIPARQSIIIEMVGKESLLNAIALNSSAFHAARMIGPAIAGFIIGSIGLGYCFFLNSLSFLAIITALLKMRFKPEDEKHSSSHDIKKSFREGLKYIFHNPDVYTILIAVGIISFFGFPYISFLPVYAEVILKVGATGLGMLMGCAGAGAFTGAIMLAARGDASRKGMIMAAAGVTYASSLLIFAQSTSLWLSYGMLYLVGVSGVNMIATANSIIQLSVPDALRGRVMSSFTAMFLGMAPLGNFTVGTLAHYTGTQNALAAAAGFCLLGTISVICIKPSILKL